MSKSNNFFPNYIKYNNLLVNDGTNVQSTVNNPQDCINKCSNNPNCQGVNIKKNDQPNVSDDGYNYQTVLPIKCEYINNICYSNTKSPNSDSNFYAKKNNSHLETNVPYILKNNDKCLSIDKNNIIIGSNCNDKKNLMPVTFDTTYNTIKIGSGSDSCLNFDGTKLNLLKCNDFSSGQKFVYENVYNTLRPYDDTTRCVHAKNMTSNGNSNYIFSVDPCEQLIGKNQTTFENYHTHVLSDSIEQFQNKDYSQDMTYYIIYISLLCIIAFLVIISSK
jgi:hypothetical protein